MFLRQLFLSFELYFWSVDTYFSCVLKWLIWFIIYWSTSNT